MVFNIYLCLFYIFVNFIYFFTVIFVYLHFIFMCTGFYSCDKIDIINLNHEYTKFKC